MAGPMGSLKFGETHDYDVKKPIKLIKSVEHKPFKKSRSWFKSKGALILQSLNPLPISQPQTQTRIPLRPENIPPAKFCSKCGTCMHQSNNATCKNCVPLEEDPTGGLFKCLSIKQCGNCWCYSYAGRFRWFRAGTHSQELLDFLLKRVELHFLSFRLLMKLKDACFLPYEANSKRIKIHLALEMQTSDDEPKQEKNCTIEFLIVYQTCPYCLISCPCPIGGWSMVVQLKQFGHCSKLTRLKLEHLLRRHRMSFKWVGHGMDVFFSREKDAMTFSRLLLKCAPVKLGPILSCNGGKRIIAWMCSIHRKDLVYLPPRVSDTLGDLGPLVICTKVTDQITFQDTSSLRRQTLTAAKYWKAPFGSLMTVGNLIEFVVLDVEIVLKGRTSCLADVQVARVSDFGKNDKMFSVRTHLGGILSPGDYALGYDLSSANFNDFNVEKCKDTLPDVVLIKKKYEQVEIMRKIKTKNSPEFEKFLTDLENNPEALFNLSLNGGIDEKTSDVETSKTGEDLAFDLENLLADLGLSDEEEDDSESSS